MEGYAARASGGEEPLLPQDAPPLARFRAAGIAAMLSPSIRLRFSHAHTHANYSMTAGAYKEEVAAGVRALGIRTHD